MPGGVAVVTGYPEPPRTGLPIRLRGPRYPDPDSAHRTRTNMRTSLKPIATTVRVRRCPHGSSTMSLPDRHHDRSSTWGSSGQAAHASNDCRATGTNAELLSVTAPADDAKSPCATAHAASNSAQTATTSCTATTTRSRTCSGSAHGTTTRRPHAKRSIRDDTSASHPRASHGRSTQGSR